jgi:hypothetical protein
MVLGPDIDLRKSKEYMCTLLNLNVPYTLLVGSQIIHYPLLMHIPIILRRIKVGIVLLLINYWKFIICGFSEILFFYFHQKNVLFFHCCTSIIGCTSHILIIDFYD